MNTGDRLGPAPPVRYFCTTSKGIEQFLVKEIESKLAALDVEHVSGKVFFTTSADVVQLEKLKAAERLFLLLKKHPPLTVPRNKGKGLHEIQKCVIGEPSAWLEAVTTWQNLQEYRKDFMGTAQNPQGGIKRKLKEDNCIAIGLKRRKQDQKLEDLGRTVSEKTEAITAFDSRPRGNSNSEVLLQTAGSPEETNQGQSETQWEGKKKLDINFRVSCRCSGELAKRFTAQVTVFLWPNSYYVVLFGCNGKEGRTDRCYLKVGAVVLDPMCGLGTILIEAAKEWPNAHFVGVDIDELQLQGACRNVQVANLMGKIDLIKGSTTELPLQSESISAIFSDIPFGKKFKSTMDMKKMLPQIIEEMERVLCVGGSLVLLLSEDLSSQMKSCFIETSKKAFLTNNNYRSLEASSYPTEQTNGNNVLCPSQDVQVETKISSLALDGIYRVSLGITKAFIHVYKKTPANL
nr:PREDICTED: THUMP domain-containing protein 2 [Latimeria chalumnae]|eukprot:XP_014348306.1 PREDICTED: THUMP domain-containing protein 2 [Latimeria chalumnae]